MSEPLLHKKVLLEKFPGKGGWTYARLPEIAADKHAHFGWVRVNGTVDGVALKHYNLMPMGKGQLFLPVKAAIRKQIKKEAGDYVEVILYADTEIIQVPENFRLCLEDEPGALAHFQALADEEKRRLLKWLEAPLSDEARIERMARAISRLAEGSLPNI
ncbi:YdeI/OmpD-associated family protein [Flavihumibacter fluvii]|jgi:hypothetical protein|uniref:YdeI/OmpD-associated family protein n=1 Tax=Flavihumibacter fluvii TaxID=2838157 RepID=UPI001BDF1D5A|nr:YdeI/OmpD-associated family protein [Flavihumibacter fluvii]ULQ51904.1 YdeI/OmpD-associated family protein [Flavihumibacter fluvii]